MNSIPYKAEHLFKIEDVEGVILTQHLAEGHEMMGPAMSLEHNGKIIACGGIHKFWEGTGEAWMSISSKLMGPSVLKEIRKSFNMMCDGYTRVHAVTITGWRQGERTLEFLGFKFEAVLRKLGPEGKDKSVYARIR
jgi:hypothetical protein